MKVVDAYYKMSDQDGRESILVHYAMDDRPTNAENQEVKIERVYLISERSRATILEQLRERRQQVIMAKREYLHVSQELQDKWSNKILEIQAAIEELENNNEFL